jgi:hypothetical protein
MRTAVASVAVLALALGAAGCGSSSPRGQRSLDAFLRTPQGRSLGSRFPHRPGSVSCTTRDPSAKRRVAATCSTDLALRANDRVLVTFTLSWSHGSRAKTWFVFLRRDGSVESMRREGSDGSDG